MSFKKLNPILKEKLAEQNIEAFFPFQKEITSKIKSGASVYGIGDTDIGKTTSLIINVLHKLQCKAEHDAPRALIFVKDKESGLRLKEQFEVFTKGTDLRIYYASQKGNQEDQVDEIYYGKDIIISTPKQVCKLYFKNALNLNLTSMLILEDANQFMATELEEITRISQSVSKCQFIVYGNKLDKKLENLQHTFMETAWVIK